MSDATCGYKKLEASPGCRFAYPGYTLNLLPNQWTRANESYAAAIRATERWVGGAAARLVPILVILGCAVATK
jgi:hypothetical protein